MRIKTISLLGLAILFPIHSALAAEFTLTSAPRGEASKENEVYQPIADYLSKVTGEKVVYQYSENWLSYTSNMQKGAYDIVFDGPAFVSWRVHKLQHVPLVKLPQPMVWAVVKNPAAEQVKELKNLAGRTVCVHAPPNLGTLTLLSLFSNPVRQPVLVEIKGWKAAFNGVVDRKCVGTVLPLSNLKEFDPDMKKTVLLYQHKPYPNQAFTVSPRIPPDMQEKISQALLSDAGKLATRKLRDEYAKGKDMVRANKEEYFGIDDVLKDSRGFEF